MGTSLAGVLDDATRGVIDHLITCPEPGVYAVVGHDGWVTFAADGGELDQAGRHPLDPHDYPDAPASVVQFFDAAHAPEAVVCFVGSFPYHGNPGEHGALGAVQAQAPFLAAGPGIVASGWTQASMRTIDVGPTLAALLGTDLPAADGQVPAGLLTDRDDDARADHVVAFLLDGANASEVYAAIDRGDAPHLAALAAGGLTLAGGVRAAFPTATLANHVAALTGCYPGHSGVLHNAWHDRGAGVDRDLLDYAQMIDAREHLRPGAETVHEALHRARPDAVSVCTYEYADRGADWSTYAEMSAGRAVARPGRPRVCEHGEFAAHDGFRFMSNVDESSVAQARELWQRPTTELPAFCWVTFNLTDKAGHEGGPHSPMFRAALADTDARVGAVLDAVDAAGVRDRSAVVVLADHGMQQTVPAPRVHLSDLVDGARWHVVDNMFLYAREP